MYVYLIKCSIYYKIGFSKNPENRIKTVKTHNPLDVQLFAVLKTDTWKALEKELHNLFANKKSRGEWFELHEDDLLTLKLNYGFNFFNSINSVNQPKPEDSYLIEEIKKIRIDNNKIDYFIEYFEQLFFAQIKDKTEFRRICLKFDTPVIKKAIDKLFDQGLPALEAFKLVYRVCQNVQDSERNPGKYISKIVGAIYYKHYKERLSKIDLNFITERYDSELDVDETVHHLNSKKFSHNKDEFWTMLTQNFLKS